MFVEYENLRTKKRSLMNVAYNIESIRFCFTHSLASSLLIEKCDNYHEMLHSSQEKLKQSVNYSSVLNNTFQ